MKGQRAGGGGGSSARVTIPKPAAPAVTNTVSWNASGADLTIAFQLAWRKAPNTTAAITSSGKQTSAGTARAARESADLVPGAAVIGRVQQHLDEVAHLAEARVDALAHALSQQLRLAPCALRLRRGVAISGRGAPGARVLVLRKQSVVGREERRLPRVVPAGDQLIHRLHLELAAAALPQLVDRQHVHFGQRPDDL